jgi:hypothetical protein
MLMVLMMLPLLVAGAGAPLCPKLMPAVAAGVWMTEGGLGAIGGGGGGIAALDAAPMID